MASRDVLMMGVLFDAVGDVNSPILNKMINSNEYNLMATNELLKRKCPGRNLLTVFL